MAANHSREQVHRLKAAVGANGFARGLTDTFFTDQGGYVRTHGGTVSDLAAALLPGPYPIPAYRVRGHIRLTNKTPSGTYRAPGRYETAFACERLMDAIAARLGLDPMEMRRVNLIPEDRMPFDRGVTAVGAAIAAAVDDALGRSGLAGSMSACAAEAARGGNTAGKVTRACSAWRDCPGAVSPSAASPKAPCAGTR